MGDNLAKVIDLYVESERYKRLAEGSKDYYYRSLMLVRQSIGDMLVDEVKPYVIQAILDELTDRPAKQKLVCASVKAMESWALLRNLLPHAITVRGMELVGSDGGFDPWTDDQIRTALDNVPPHLRRVIKLEINTGQRSSDIIRMRWSDLEEIDGRLGINVRTQKTDLPLWIPFLEDFAEEVRGWVRQSPIIVLDKSGIPYATRNRLSQEWGLERDTNPALVALRSPPKVLHGLRSSTVVRLRKLGLTELQISSLIGMSEKMVHRYSRHANQKTMAAASVEHLENKTIVFTRKVKRNQ